MQMPSQAQLLAAIDAFLERHPQIGEARFGRDATGEPGLLGRLRKGSSPTLRIGEQIVAYMAGKDREAGHAPDDASEMVRSSPGNADEVSGRAEVAA